MYTLLCYPNCSTCAKANKQLIEMQVEFTVRNIKEQNPTKEELKQWIATSKLPIKKFFNTSGQVYKELGLKDTLKEMNDEEKIELLSSNGMLVKRPLLVSEDFVLVGYRADDYQSLQPTKK